MEVIRFFISLVPVSDNKLIFLHSIPIPIIIKIGSTLLMTSKSTSPMFCGCSIFNQRIVTLLQCRDKFYFHDFFRLALKIAVTSSLSIGLYPQSIGRVSSAS